MGVSAVPGKLMLLIGKDTLKVLEARFDLKNNVGNVPGAGDFLGKSDARMSSWTLRWHPCCPIRPGSFMIRSGHRRHRDNRFSANVTKEEFTVRRVPGPRTVRDILIASGRWSFQRVHRTFRRQRQRKTTANERRTKTPVKETDTEAT